MSEVSATPALEVVICIYNNGAMLDGVLSTLACQRPVATASWSCLVVDNSSTEDTANVIGRHILAGAIPDLRSVRQSQQGLTFARLRSVRSTTAQWVAFVDDDCFLQSDCIAQAIAFAESHSWVGAFGGRVARDWEAEPPRYVRAYGYCVAEQDHGNFPQQVTFLAGAGLVVNRLALSACGWIDAPLLADRVGEKLVSGGDVALALRIAGIGRELCYLPQCVLKHRIPARRFSPRYLINTNRNLGISQALAYALLGLARVTFEVTRKRKASAQFFVQARFKLGQLQGIWRVLTMSPSRRRELLGRARPGSGRDRSRPGEVG